TEQSDGKLHLAHFFFNVVVLANEENGRAWNGLGRIHELAGDLERALTFYKKAEENEWSGGIRSQFVLFMRHHRYDEVYEILPKVKDVFDQDLDVQILFFGFSVAVGDRE